jgi:hypothetical protein
MLLGGGGMGRLLLWLAGLDSQRGLEDFSIYPYSIYCLVNLQQFSLNYCIGLCLITVDYHC